MRLKNYIPQTNKKYGKIFFSGIPFNSINIKKNNIFCNQNNEIDGNNFIQDAIKKGSKIIITEKKIKPQKGILFINTKTLSYYWVSFKVYDKKPKNLIAVTGTNGKSSVSDFYYQILTLNNKVASIGTLGVKSNKFNLDLTNTTIDPVQLGKILKKLNKLKKIML